MLNDNSEDMSGESATMVAYHLYHIAEDTNKLSQTDADLFHHFVEQLLYLKNQARTDIQLTVLFLLTIVIYLDTDDYKNLERKIKYIQGTIDPQFILSIDKSDNIQLALRDFHETTSVAPCVLVHHKFCINVPLYMTCILEGSMVGQWFIVCTPLSLP